MAQHDGERRTRRVSAVDVATEADMALAAVRLAWASVLTADEQSTLDRAAAICGRLSDMDVHNSFLPAPAASSLSVAGPAVAPARSQCSPEREVTTGAGLAPFGFEAQR